MSNPDGIYNELLESNSNSRTRDSLRIINEVCREQHEKHKSKDFSVATIGKIVNERGGPSERAIRNKTGALYRALIEAWGTSVNGNTRKTRDVNLSEIEKAFSRIEEPGIRTLALSIHAQLRKKENELREAKRILEENLQIDLRPKAIEPLQQLLPASSVFGLNKMEIDALREAVSEEKMQNEDWEKLQNGSVNNSSGRRIYRAGYTHAIEKILRVLE